MISESGLVAWIYAQTNVALKGKSFVSIFMQNSDASGDDVFPGLSVGSKIQIHDNSFTFTASKVRRVTRKPSPPAGSTTNSPGNIVQPETVATPEMEIVDIGGREINNTGEISASASQAQFGRASKEAYNEVFIWDLGLGGVRRVPGSGKAGFSPHLWGKTVDWQEEQPWPFGYEIMALVNGRVIQLTTNNYYELSPRAYENKIVWYGWDGNDYEIFLYDHDSGQTSQITSNLFDDIVPQISGAAIIWEASPGVEGDIYMYKDGIVTNISGGVEDDINPRLWNDKVVWQGFDGDDFEIYLYDITKGGPALKLTSNNFDDTNPEIGSELVVWVGYHENWDAEIFYTDIRTISSSADIKVIQLTTNDSDDVDPKTAGPRIVWVGDESGLTQIMLAEP